MSESEARPSPLSPPRDVVDGIPDRVARRPLWKYLLVAAAFVGWLGVLLLLYLIGC